MNLKRLKLDSFGTKIDLTHWLGNDQGVTGGSSAIAAQVWGNYVSKALR